MLQAYLVSDNVLEERRHVLVPCFAACSRWGKGPYETTADLIQTATCFVREDALQITGSNPSVLSKVEAKLACGQQVLGGSMPGQHQK